MAAADAARVRMANVVVSSRGAHRGEPGRSRPDCESSRDAGGSASPPSRSVLPGLIGTGSVRGTSVGFGKRTSRSLRRRFWARFFLARCAACESRLCFFTTGPSGCSGRQQLMQVQRGQPDEDGKAELDEPAHRFRFAEGGVCSLAAAEWSRLSHLDALPREPVAIGLDAAPPHLTPHPNSMGPARLARTLEKRRRSFRSGFSRSNRSGAGG